MGFVGTLLVIQPSFAAVGWPAVLPLCVAVIFALFMLITRQIAKQTDPIGLQAVSGVMACAVLAPLLLWGQSTDLPPLQILALRPQEWALLILIGVLGTLAHLMMTWSLKFAPSATLAPMQYLEIPVATAIGWVIIGDLPDGLASLGIVITIAAGLYIVLHERALVDRQPMHPPTEPPV